MPIISPEIEFVDRSVEGLRYLEHGWPTDLCRWHAHEELELHLITATRGKALVGDHIGEFRPGSLYLIGPNLPHNWVTDRAETGAVPVRDRLVQFHEDSIGQLVGAFPECRGLGRLIELSRSGVAFTGFPLQEATACFNAISRTTGAARVAAFLAFMTSLDRHEEKTPLSIMRMTRSATSSRDRIGAVIDHIAQNFAEALPVAAAAEMAGMSEASFSRGFRAATGLRYTDFLNRVRIGQACALLFDTDERISSICFDVGFQNLANFNRCFLKVKSVTPTEYRRTMRRTLGEATAGR